jgi:hypothetical protein
VQNFLTRDIARDRKGEQGQPHRQRGYQDRSQPLLSSPQDELSTADLTFVPFEMLIVVDQQNAVASRYPEHGEESEQRSQ